MCPEFVGGLSAPMYRLQACNEPSLTSPQCQQEAREGINHCAADPIASSSSESVRIVARATSRPLRARSASKGRFAEGINHCGVCAPSSSAFVHMPHVQRAVITSPQRQQGPAHPRTELNNTGPVLLVRRYDLESLAIASSTRPLPARPISHSERYRPIGWPAYKENHDPSDPGLPAHKPLRTPGHLQC